MMLLHSLPLLLALHTASSCLTADSSREKRAAKVALDPSSELHRDLLEDYNADVIPMLGASTGDSDENAMTINLGVQLINLELEGTTLRSTAWLKMSWMDFRLSWDPELYGGLQSIRVPAAKLWLPDFEMYNAVNFGVDSFSERMASGPGLAIVYSSGFVLFIPPVDIQTGCSKNDKDFDCELKIGSWTYDGFHIKLAGFDNKTMLLLDNVQRSSPYLVTSQEGDALQTKYYPCCPEPYMHLSFNFTVRSAGELPAEQEDYFAAYQEDLVVGEERRVKLRGY